MRRNKMEGMVYKLNCSIIYNFFYLNNKNVQNTRH